MNFAENLLSLEKVMFYAAPSDRNPTPFVIPENRHVVEIITGGTVYFGSGSKKLTYRRGTIFWHVSGDKTIFETTPQDPYRCIVFHFSAAAPERLAPRVSSWLGNNETFEDFIRQSHRAFFAQNSNPELAKIVGAYCLSELLMHALDLKALDSRSLLTPTPNTDEILLHNILGYIENNLAGDLTSSELAEKLKIPRNRLFKLFKNYLNSSLTDYIAEKRCELARRLLESSSKPIKEIAAECGFEYVEVFHRRFVKHVGTTPQQYRKNANPYRDLLTENHR